MDLFSRRHKLQKPSIGLVYENVPTQVRIALCNLLDIHLEEAKWKDVQMAMFQAPQVKSDYEFSGQHPHTQKAQTLQILKVCMWYTFFDICELLCSKTRMQCQYFIDSFEEELNQIFADNSIGYELKDGKIERIGAPYIDEVVRQARKVLQNPNYSGPNEQFEKAISFLNQRPNSDTANCVKDAICAVEGLAKMVSGKTSLTFSRILEEEPFRSDIHGALREMMQKLYGYRGDAEGAAHGQTSIGQILVEDAEFVLGVSASCMIYLAKKFGKES